MFWKDIGKALEVLRGEGAAGPEFLSEVTIPS